MMVGVVGPSMNMASLLHICALLFLTFTHEDKSTLLSRVAKHPHTPHIFIVACPLCLDMFTLTAPLTR